MSRCGRADDAGLWWGEWDTEQIMCRHCVSSPLLSLPPTIIAQDEYPPTFIAIFKDFGLESLADELLAADGVHHLGNLLSLSSEIRYQFNSLGLWFEATDTVCY